MTKRFKMSDALYTIRNGFFINDLAGTKNHQHIETFPNLPLQDLKLYLSHHLHLNLL